MFCILHKKSVHKSKFVCGSPFAFALSNFEQIRNILNLKKK